MGPFLWGKLTPQDTITCKDFNSAIEGGLGWMKWLKNGAGKYLYFMQLFLHYILFGENFIVKVTLSKVIYVKVILYSVCLNLSHEKKNSNQNGKVEKMVVLVKTFDHYHHKFQLFELSGKIVKEFETEI